MEPIRRINTALVLDQALNEVAQWEDVLTRGASTKQIKRIFTALRDGHLDLGSPQAHLRRLHPKDFEKQGLALSSEIAESMQGKDGYAYYVAPVPVLLYPGRGAQYRLLESQLSLPGKDQRVLGIHSIFPEPYWKPVLSWGGSLGLALDGNLQWGAEVDPTMVKLSQLKGELAGRVKNTNELTSYLKVFPFEHTLGRMEIEAQFSSHKAMWRLDSKQVIRDQKHISLILLLKVPKAVRQVRLKAAAQAEVSFDWLTAQVSHVLERLPQAFQNAVNQRKGLPLQDFQSWTLDLPA